MSSAGATARCILSSFGKRSTQWSTGTIPICIRSLHTSARSPASDGILAGTPILRNHSAVFSRQGIQSLSTGPSSTDTTNGDTSGSEKKDPLVSGLVEDNSEITVKAVMSKVVELKNMKPSEIVTELERHIVGQSDAKRAVAVAMRNRWRRQQLPDELQKEVMPRNILMIGPTGCGKTEVARRLSKIANAPFLKVEATKFTEVGFHGRDVDMIIRDLVEQGILMRKLKREALLPMVQDKVANQIIQQLVGSEDPDDMQKWLKMYHSKELDKIAVEVEIPVTPPGNQTLMAGGGDANGISAVPIADLISKLQGRGNAGSPPTPTMKTKKMLVPDARKSLENYEIEKILDDSDLTADAIKLVEQNGIVFIDEIDKICNAEGSRNSGDASDEGVQRDLLPLIEGSTINTKHGNINTDYILFIASGAFHHCKPADLLPELQGRLPIRVELNGLKEKDLLRILTEPEVNMIRQQIALLETDGVKLVFEDEAIQRIAHVAAEMNTQVENIGARRLHTVMERMMDDISFDASDMKPDSTVTITAKDVDEKLGSMLTKMDLTKFIL